MLPRWVARPILPEFGAVPVDERVVVDRNRITGAGVTAGLDLGLRITAMLRDDGYAPACCIDLEGRRGNPNPV